MDPVTRIRWIQTLAVAFGAAPLVALGVRAWLGDLAADPIEDITHVTGEWGLRFLILTLAVTPLRRLLRWRWIAPLRRTFGLTAFVYACLHLLTFLGLEHAFDWHLIVQDAFERRYVTAGLAAVLCLIPLAATSTRAMARRLGRSWKSLHRLAYAAAVLAVIHLFWLVKADYLDPILYATALAGLFGARAWLWHRGRVSHLDARGDAAPQRR